MNRNAIENRSRGDAICQCFIPYRRKYKPKGQFLKVNDQINSIFTNQ